MILSRSNWNLNQIIVKVRPVTYRSLKGSERTLHRTKFLRNQRLLSLISREVRRILSLDSTLTVPGSLD